MRGIVFYDDARLPRLSFAAGAALLALLAACSISFARSAASGGDDESLADKVNDPTASLTQFKVQDIYTPAEYARMLSRIPCRSGLCSRSIHICSRRSNS